MNLPVNEVIRSETNRSPVLKSSLNRFQLHSRETTRRRKCEPVTVHTVLLADAPSRWRAIVAGGVLLIVISVCLPKIQILFPQNIGPCRQYEATMLVETDAVAQLKTGGERCPARGCHATATKFQTALEEPAPATGPASRVLTGSLPKPTREVFAQREAPDGVRSAHNDGLFGIAGKFGVTYGIGISARVEVTVEGEIPLGLTKLGVGPATSK